MPLPVCKGSHTNENTESDESSVSFVSVEYSKEEHLDPSARSYQAFDWLISAHLPPTSSSSSSLGVEGVEGGDTDAEDALGVEGGVQGCVEGLEGGVAVWGKAQERAYLTGFELVETVHAFKALRPRGYSPKADQGEVVKQGYLVDIDLPVLGVKIKVMMPVVAVLVPSVHILRRRQGSA